MASLLSWLKRGADVARTGADLAVPGLGTADLVNRLAPAPIRRGAQNVATGVVVPAVVGAGEVYNRDINAPLQATGLSIAHKIQGRPDSWANNYNRVAGNLTNAALTAPNLISPQLQGQVQGAYNDPRGTAIATALTALAPEFKALGTIGKGVEAGVGGYFGSKAISQVPSEIKNIKTLKGDERTQAITEAIANTGLGVLGAVGAAHGTYGVAKDLLSPSNATKLAVTRGISQNLSEDQAAQRAAVRQQQLAGQAAEIARQKAATELARTQPDTVNVRRIQGEQNIAMSKKLAAQKAESLRQAEINRARNEANAVNVRQMQGEQQTAQAKQEAQRTAGIQAERQGLIQERQKALDAQNAAQPTINPNKASATEVVNTLAQERADLLRQAHKDTGGVSLTRDADGMVTGRVSSNDSFYRQFYRENKKPPTRADWLAEAHRQLARGTDENATLYQDALKSANQPPQPIIRDVQTGKPTIDLGSKQQPGAPRNQGPLISDVPTTRKLPTVGTPTVSDVTASKVSQPKGVPVKVAESAKSGPIDGLSSPKVTPAIKATAPVDIPVKKAAPAAEPVPSNEVFADAKIAKKTGILAQLKNLTNPVAEYGETGRRAASALQSKLGQLASDLRPSRADSAARQAVFDKMTPQEHLKFINDIQHGRPQPTPELQAIADQYKTFNAQGAEVAKGIKPDFKAMDNYFTQSGIVSREDASALARKWMDKSDTPGSLQHRTFPTVQEAVKFANDNGVALKETNPEKLFINNHQRVLTAGRLSEFEAEQAAQGVDPAITQKLIDRYSEQGLRGGAAYERYRQTAGTVSNVQLAGGFHFAKVALEKINNDTSTFLNQVASGHPIKAVESGIKNAVSNIAGFGYFKGRNFAEDVTSGVKNKYTEAAQLANYNPTQDARYVVNGFKKSLSEIATGTPTGIAKGVGMAPLRIINSAMSPLMKHWVPNIKNAAFMAQVDAADAILGKNATVAERALAYQKAGNTVDGIMGQMNQDNLFWNKTMKDSLGVAMRSPGYNIGTVQQVGGGIKDLVQPHPIQALRGEGSVLPTSIDSLLKGKGLSTRSAYTVAMTVNAMTIGAVMTYMFTGKGPTEIKDYFFPPTGKTDKNGNAERVSIPSYTKDIFAFVHAPVQTVANKTSPLISEGIQLAKNRDYYGNMIRNPEDSVGTQAKQVGSYLKNQNQPFSVQSMNKRVDKGIAAKAESLGGITVAPGYITQSPFQQKVQSALSTATGSKALTPEQSALVGQKSQAKTAAAGGDSSQIKALLDSGQITAKQADNLQRSSGQSSLANQFNYLLKVDKVAAGDLIAHASPADIAKLNPSDVAKSQDALALKNKNSGGNSYVGTSPDITALPSGKYSVSIDSVDKTFKTHQQAQAAVDFQNFKDSDKNYQVSNGIVYRKDAQGNASQVPKTKFDYQVGTATLTAQKNADNIDGWLKTANGQLDSIAKQLKDPSIDPLDALTLQNEAESLQKNITKYKGYGGFTKPKAGKKAGTTSLSSGFKTSSFKAPSISGVKIRKASAPRVRSVKRLPVSKIPSSSTRRKLK